VVDGGADGCIRDPESGCHAVRRFGLSTLGTLDTGDTTHNVQRVRLSSGRKIGLTLLMLGKLVGIHKLITLLYIRIPTSTTYITTYILGCYNYLRYIMRTLGKSS